LPNAPFYLTTAIDYANGEPHLGHAFEKIGADTIARYHRQAGRAVHFLIGMDEHGQKVAQTAEGRGQTPQALVDEVAGSFQAMWARLGISYDQFIRTTAAEHQAGVQALITRIFERNPDDFYEKAYEGLYCVGCESFKTEGEVVDGKCPLHATRELQWTRETNWFFRLSRYQRFLEQLLRERPDFCRAGEPPQRDPGAARAGAGGRVGQPLATRLGRAVSPSHPRRRDAGDLRLVRRAAQLPHGNRLPDRRL
jgi:methionyl-tRNA synthetase